MKKLVFKNKSITIIYTMSFCCNFLGCSESTKPQTPIITTETIILSPSKNQKIVSLKSNTEEIPQLSLPEITERVTVIDNGSYEIKAGFAGQNTNSCTFKSVVGKSTQNVSYVGNEINSHDDLVLEYPIEKGIIGNWDNMEKLWKYTFDQLGQQDEKGAVLLTDKPLNPKQNREKMTTSMFETCNVPAMYVFTDAVSSLYAIGRTSGIVVQSGYGVTHTVPIYDGHIINSGIQQLDFGGYELTKYMSKILKDRDYDITHDIANDIKENLSYVAFDYDSEIHNFSESSELEKEYVLPDNTTINISTERVRCSETLFRPNEFAFESGGIHQSTFMSIMLCDIDVRKDLYSNILLAGGNTMFPGIATRLTKEITTLAPAAVKIKVIDPPERKNSAWIGGSTIASLSTFQQMWISKQEYDETGPSIVYRKCY